MKKIILTQNKIALVDDSDFESINKFKWYAQKHGRTFYARRNSVKGGKRITIRMHRQLLRLKKNVLCDHINGNGLDNQRKNLRIANYHQNNQNRIGYGISGFKGVYWHKLLKKWIAQIRINGKKKHLGVFEKKVDAAIAYNLIAKDYFEDFAKLNIV
jgi:hypothetical protein